MHKALTLVAMFVATSVFASAPYHLELQSSPAVVLPLLGKFGTMEIHVYDGGVRVESLAFDSFSRNGSSTVTLLNPIARLYTEVPIDEFPSLIERITGIHRSAADVVPKVAAPIAGKVNGLDARRYRLSWTPTDWMDVWTIAVPESPQLRRVVDAFVRHFAPHTAGPLARIPGNPVYVELNTVDHPKFPLLQMRSLKMDDHGEDKALHVGKWFFKAPLPDAILK
jgi:hypothetical protein